MLSEETLYRHSPPWLQTVLLNLHAARIDRHRYGGRFRAALDRLVEMEEWEGDEIRAFQDAQLRSIVQHAYDRTRYYRKLFDEERLKPADVRSVDDLPKIPILTKAIIRERAPELLSAKPPKGWLRGVTNGTTGTPLSVWYDRQTCVMTNAVDARHKEWVGLERGDWVGLFFGRTIVSPRQTQPPFWRANHVHKQLWFSTFHLSAANLPDYAEEIRRRRLRFLDGYPSAIFILANYLQESGDVIPMNGVITSSETLYPAQRATIEAAFDCEVFDFYAMAERVIHAGECQDHEGKHLSEEYGYAEVVNEKGEPVEEGVPGYLVGTSLINYAMPMIRYDTRDTSAIISSACNCGRQSRRMTGVATKVEDLVITPDGRSLPPTSLHHPFNLLFSIRKSQVIQEEIDQLVVRIVPQGTFSEADGQSLIQKLKERTGPDMNVTIEITDEIPLEPGGKYRWVISKLNPSKMDLTKAMLPTK